MPLVAKASRRVKQPAYQRGTRPPLKEQRDAQAITANHEQKFTSAFTTLLRDLISPDMLKAIRRAIRDNRDADSIVAAIPFLDPNDPETFPPWEGFRRRVERTYTLVIDEAIENENRKHGWSTEVLKADLVEPLLPIDATASEFVRIKALQRVVGMANTEKERVRDILIEGIDGGSHVTSMVGEIRDTVGLTTKQRARLNRRMQAALDAGMSEERALEFRARGAAKVRLQRARAISRTETAAALAQGLKSSWSQASSAGLMPPGTKKRWVSMPFEEGRSSEICQELDGQEVLLNEQFTSSEGSFDGAPAHVH